MPFNVTFDKHHLKLGAIGLFALAAVVVLAWQASGLLFHGGGGKAEWFYDLNTGQLFAGYSGEIPPIDAPSGPTADGVPAGVLAHVYSIGDDSDPKNRIIAYLETSHPKGLQAAIHEFGDNRRAITFVKRAGDSQWVLRRSREGQIIMQEYRRKYADQLNKLRESHP